MPQLILLCAIPFLWLGMVAAISFLETPLKFRAPGMTVPLGVGIGRIVYRALNTVEAVLAVVAMVAVLSSARALPAAAVSAIGLAVALLVLQLAVLRPRMAGRTRDLARVAAGSSSSERSGVYRQDAPAGGAGTVEARVATAPHLLFIAAETIKTVALLAGGILMLIAVVR